MLSAEDTSIESISYCFTVQFLIHWSQVRLLYGLPIKSISYRIFRGFSTENVDNIRIFSTIEASHERYQEQSACFILNVDILTHLFSEVIEIQLAPFTISQPDDFLPCVGLNSFVYRFLFIVTLFEPVALS